MENRSRPAFITFLQEELQISDSELNIALRCGETDPCLLSVTLWRYGFITLEMLERIFDWLANARSNSFEIGKTAAI